MRLIDRVGQCKTPFLVESTKDSTITQLTGAAAYAGAVQRCATRYVLSDELTRLCTALAYSKGASTLACEDLLHVPAQRVWIEWCRAPWLNEIELYGFRRLADESEDPRGRRGVLIESSTDGRRGVIRTFWANGDADLDVLASSMEAYFDFDALDDTGPEAPDDPCRPGIAVIDDVVGGVSVLRRCFRFRFERTWHVYYEQGQLSTLQKAALTQHALGTIAIDIPVVLAFFLLLSTRPGLPQRPLMLERLNRARVKNGKTPLLEQVEVFAPVLPEYRSSGSAAATSNARGRRLHHVRGHLVRRGSKLFWRVPHLRGSARLGTIRARTVTWRVDKNDVEQPRSEARV